MIDFLNKKHNIWTKCKKTLFIKTQILNVNFPNKNNSYYCKCLCKFVSTLILGLFHLLTLFI